MKPLSTEPAFIPVTADVNPLAKNVRRSRGAAESVEALGAAPFDTAYDMLRAVSSELVAKGETRQALALMEELEAFIASMPEAEAERLADVHALLLMLATSLRLESDDLQGGAELAARALAQLAQQPRRKDGPFMQILAALLYDIAYLHSERGEYKQAEREIEKSIKVYERLARTDAARYASPHMMALGRATEIYRNRVRQAELLAHYQAATTAYMEQLNAGSEDAAGRLVESLAHQGDTLAHMGRQREAMQYYTRALKYLTRIEADFTLHQLQLSIALGRTMLEVSAMREKGVHLLNTMLHKATKINALEEHREIVDMLLNAKSRKLDMLGLWHKVFPK
ncbi:MAG: hypothetical protein K2K92_06475 [Duncaniella sp.]|nr:hypothetical protein [Duncaniella sp.]